MKQEVAVTGGFDESEFQENMNDEISWRIDNGWELVDTEISTIMDDETGDIVYTAVLTFEG